MRLEDEQICREGVERVLVFFSFFDKFEMLVRHSSEVSKAVQRLV